MMTRGVQTARVVGATRVFTQRGTRHDKEPPPEQRAPGIRDSMLCRRCGALYRHKGWHVGLASLRKCRPGSIRFTTCPACQRERQGVGFGRILLRGAYARLHEEELCRRIRNVSIRARSNQPERRLVSVMRDEGGLEVLATSQRLAHRVARELVKTHAGKATYHWDDHDGALLVVWRRER